jgi:hypothetical protein
MEDVKEPAKLKDMEFLRWVSLVLNDPTFTKQDDSYAERTAATATWTTRSTATRSTATC